MTPEAGIDSLSIPRLPPCLLRAELRGLSHPLGLIDAGQRVARDRLALAVAELARQLEHAGEPCARLLVGTLREVSGVMQPAIARGHQNMMRFVQDATPALPQAPHGPKGTSSSSSPPFLLLARLRVRLVSRGLARPCEPLVLRRIWCLAPSTAGVRLASRGDTTPDLASPRRQATAPRSPPFPAALVRVVAASRPARFAQWPRPSGPLVPRRSRGWRHAIGGLRGSRGGSGSTPTRPANGHRGGASPWATSSATG